MSHKRIVNLFVIFALALSYISLAAPPTTLASRDPAPPPPPPPVGPTRPPPAGAPPPIERSRNTSIAAATRLTS